MQKYIWIKTHNVPNSNIFGPTQNHRGDSYHKVFFNMSDLYHSLFTALHGYCFGNSFVPLWQHWEQFIADKPYISFHGQGLGANSETRKGTSNAYGHAFCQLILRQYFNITYFLDVPYLPKVGDYREYEYLGNTIRVQRVQQGDMADYICAAGGPALSIYSAEAKGRLRTFSNEIGGWLGQFQRVGVSLNSSPMRPLKGLLAATRIVDSDRNPRTEPFSYLEDPETFGEGNFSEDDLVKIKNTISYIHYSSILTRSGISVDDMAWLLDFGVRIKGFEDQLVLLNPIPWFRYHRLLRMEQLSHRVPIYLIRKNVIDAYLNNKIQDLTIPETKLVTSEFCSYFSDGTILAFSKGLIQSGPRSIEVII